MCVVTIALYNVYKVQSGTPNFGVKHLVYQIAL